MSRLLTTVLLVGVLLAGGGGDVRAQMRAADGEADLNSVPVDTTVRHEGRVALTDWPASLPRLLDEMGTKAPYLLPAVDSLGLDYRYAANDSTSRWSFVLGWRPGANVLYRGDVQPREQGPSGIRMANVELRARVQVDGDHVGDMIVAVDSMRLAPVPSLYTFEVTVDHDRVFLDGDAEAARTALLQGATLDRLVVERMGFVADESSTSERSQTPDARERRREPSSAPSVYTTTRILIGWRVASRPYYVDEEEDQRTESPRGETMGRQREADEAREQTTDRSDQSDEEESAGRDRSSESTDEKEEDDEEAPNLRLPALGAAAAVGLAAYVGGTVGLYGRGDTPIGVAAGYTHSSGGVQLQAAVNGAVLDGTSNQKLTVKAFGFYDVFGARLQPGVGLGGHIDPADGRDLEPALSLGVAANFHQFVVFGGVDVVQQTPEVGLTYNFRYNRGSSDEEEAP